MDDLQQVFLQHQQQQAYSSNSSSSNPEVCSSSSLVDGMCAGHVSSGVAYVAAVSLLQQLVCAAPAVLLSAGDELEDIRHCLQQHEGILQRVLAATEQVQQQGQAGRSAWPPANGVGDSDVASALSETAAVLGLVDGCLSRQAALSAAVAPRLLGFSVPRAMKDLSKAAATGDVAAAVNTAMAAARKLMTCLETPSLHQGR